MGRTRKPHEEAFICFGNLDLHHFILRFQEVLKESWIALLGSDLVSMELVENPKESQKGVLVSLQSYETRESDDCSFSGVSVCISLVFFCIFYQLIALIIVIRINRQLRALLG